MVACERREWKLYLPSRDAVERLSTRQAAVTGMCSHPVVVSVSMVGSLVSRYRSRSTVALSQGGTLRGETVMRTRVDCLEWRGKSEGGRYCPALRWR